MSTGPRSKSRAQSPTPPSSALLPALPSPVTLMSSEITLSLAPSDTTEHSSGHASLPNSASLSLTSPSPSGSGSDGAQEEKSLSLQCDLDRDELRADGFKLTDPCPCGVLVYLHPRRAVPLPPPAPVIVLPPAAP